MWGQARRAAEAEICTQRWRVAARSIFWGESCVWGSSEEGRNGQYLQLPLFFLNSVTTQVLLVTLGSLTQAIKSEISFP